MCHTWFVSRLSPSAMSHRVFQVLQAGEQAGIGTRTAEPAELGQPAAAVLGCPTSAASATGGLGSQQDPPELSPSPEGLGPETRSAAGESEEGAAGRRDLAAGEEGSKQLTSASGAEAAPHGQGQRQGSVPGTAVGCVPVCPSQSRAHVLFLLHLWHWPWSVVALILFSLSVSFFLWTPFPSRPLTRTGRGVLGADPGQGHCEGRLPCCCAHGGPGVV